MAKIFIHPGAHKTATTAIQSVLDRIDRDDVSIITPKNYRLSKFDRVWRGLDSGDALSLFNEEGGLNDQVQHVSHQVRCCHEPLLSPSFC